MLSQHMRASSNTIACRLDGTWQAGDVLLASTDSFPVAIMSNDSQAEDLLSAAQIAGYHDVIAALQEAANAPS